MKSELATAIAAAIAGVLISYFAVGLFTGEIEPVSVKTIEGEVSTELSDPNPEVFNYKSLNPTVEVYIGNGNAEETAPENQENQENQENTNSGEDTTNNSEEYQENF